jgi:hypothetical protein
MIQGAADKPDFLWDETLSRDQLKRLLANGNEEERFYYAAKILREARFEEVWEYLTPVFFGRYWDKLRTRLGRKKQFWRFLREAPACDPPRVCVRHKANYFSNTRGAQPLFVLYIY